MGYPNVVYKDDFRSVPEERIKCCSGQVRLHRWVHDELPMDEEMRKQACDTMGRMIAEKLMEFQKVKVTDEGPYRVYSYWLEVIVPDGPPT